MNLSANAYVTDYKFRLYLVNTCIQYLFSVFWLIFILYGILKGEDFASNLNAFASLLFMVGILDLIFGVAADLISKKLLLIIGSLSFVFASICRIYSEDALHMQLSFILFGIFIACVNGTLQAWSLNFKNRHFPEVSDDKLHGHLHFCRRIAQAINITTPIILAVNQDVPWYLCIGVSLIAVSLIFSEKSKTKIETGMIFNEAQQNKAGIKGGFSSQLALWTVFSVMIFYGLEFGIRNVIITPFVYFDLNNGNVENLWLQVLAQVIGGVAGNLYYSKKLVNKVRFYKSFYIALALFLYGLANCVSSFTHSYFVWLICSGVAVFSMGWYFPALDAFITENSPKEYKATCLSLKTAIYYISGGAILKIYISEITFDTFRQWWLYSGYFLFIGAGIFMIYQAFEKFYFTNYEGIKKNG